MPGTFLTTAERERLSRFPASVSPPDLMTYFALSDHDHAFLDPYRSDSTRLGVALQLCSMRWRCLKGVDMLFSMSVSAAEHPQRDRVAS